MAQIKCWTVSDALWSKIEPFVPGRKRPQGRKYRRKPGAGRKPMPARQIFAAIVYVLRTGCQWKALPKEFGSASAVHAHFQRWQRDGFFLKDMEGRLGRVRRDGGHRLALAEHGRGHDKAPLATECVGPNPTDRGKKWAQAQPPGGRPWSPAVDRRKRGQPA